MPLSGPDSTTGLSIPIAQCRARHRDCWVGFQGELLRCDSAGWDVEAARVWGEGILHGGGRDCKEQALKDFH